MAQPKGLKWICCAESVESCCAKKDASSKKNKNKNKNKGWGGVNVMSVKFTCVILMYDTLK